MTTLLAIETATQSCSAAVLHKNKISSKFQIAPRQHSDLILPMIDTLLTNVPLSRSQLQAVAVGIGPGSFMGTRLAVGVAQGLAYALNIPVIPVSTLQILAQTAYEAEGCERVMSGWDARMGEVYWGVYQLLDGIMQPQQIDRLSCPDDVVFDHDTVLVGNAWSLYWERPYVECYPHAASLLTLAKPLFTAGKVTAPLTVTPVYLREKIATSS